MMRFAWPLLFLLGACDSGQRPLDARTRQRIDSLTYVRTNRLRVEMDSLCKLESTTALPLLIDSIRRVREQEIADQLRTIPQ